MVNAQAKTLEVVRYSENRDQVARGAIPTSAITEKTKVLFSSNNCQEGKAALPDDRDNKSIGEELEEQISQLVDNPTPSKEAVDAIRQLIEKK